MVYISRNIISILIKRNEWMVLYKTQLNQLIKFLGVYPHSGFFKEFYALMFKAKFL